ncbi:C4-dicarboxylate ABC transporter permease [candidate division KSB3 bacterium]|uniref:C4-dicarboxylate ABC transporter permease n=1 Tax=candidate division KSB3 bacterium TaxID=2044937 RepID=A0A2G6E5H7_9BACT|nr:MAG: C4-dicarboxylate ABC transporter permease [candidate division KSB3 bacterium]PIE29802.1 MAG: C4-dicarboxylate ABC transporter permease [candidate division KSB3 bacterium]
MKDTGNNSIVRVITRASIFFERAAAYPCIAATAGMTIVVLLGVFFRYAIRQPLSWSEEVARYLMIWAASLAISIGIMRREHLGITMFIHRLPHPVQKAAAVLVNVIVLWFLWVLTKFGYFMAIEGKTQLSPILARYGISMFWSLLAIPVAGAFAMVQTVLQILLDMFEKKEGLDIKGSVDI